MMVEEAIQRDEGGIWNKQLLMTSLKEGGNKAREGEKGNYKKIDSATMTKFIVWVATTRADVR